MAVAYLKCESGGGIMVKILVTFGSAMVEKYRYVYWVAYQSVNGSTVVSTNSQSSVSPFTVPMPNDKRGHYSDN